MEHIFVKKVNPKNSIRDPYTGKKILECGQLVPKNRYWLSKVEAGILEELPVNGIPMESETEDTVPLSRKKKGNN